MVSVGLVWGGLGVSIGCGACSRKKFSVVAWRALSMLVGDLGCGFACGGGAPPCWY